MFEKSSVATLRSIVFVKISSFVGDLRLRIVRMISQRAPCGGCSFAHYCYIPFAHFGISETCGYITDRTVG